MISWELWRTLFLWLRVTYGCGSNPAIPWATWVITGLDGQGVLRLSLSIHCPNEGYLSLGKKYDKIMT